MSVLRSRRSRIAEAAAAALAPITPADRPAFALGALAFAAAALLVQAVAFAAPPAPPAPSASRLPLKWVDASGRVHYSDRQPSPDALGRGTSPQAIAARPAEPSIGDPTLPWALRSAAARYPVTLYTSAECEPCGLAREHLAQRGVPYTEKRVNDAADLKAFHALGFEKAFFPSVSIGPEKLSGFESVGWDRALDATGYPRSSMLPPRRDPRTVAPMRTETRPATAEATPDAPAAASSAASADATPRDVDSLLSPASFRTGPNPIRF
ncbi:MAG: glutaredoxin family protein [Burkholderiaceae bacterium]|nr:glutaredoxin family protein [Burkholderiaceae bacterium]